MLLLNEQFGMTQAELAERTGRQCKTIVEFFVEIWQEFCVLW